jgi:hypothetical protein
MVDYTNKKFNHLTVLTQYRKNNNSIAICQWDCGRKKEIRLFHVVHGIIKTCRQCQYYKKLIQLNYEKNRIDYIGQKFNHLTVLAQYRKNNNSIATCQCDCGRKKDIRLSHVVHGLIKTCGQCRYHKKLIQLNYEKNSIDYTGQKFNHLTVLSEFKKETKAESRYYFHCKCDCGQKKAIQKRAVIEKKTKTCGKVECQKKISDRFLGDYVGKKFNRLTIIKQYIKNRTSFFQCNCDCGRTKTIRAYAVIHGKTRSCGCINVESIIEIGKKESPIHITLIDDSMVFMALISMGYRKNGRKIGVTFHPHFGKKNNHKWCASITFQKIKKAFWFDTYEDAEKKRLQIQKIIFMPFIMRNKNLLPKNIDIKNMINLNKDVNFKVRKYEKERIAGKRV